MPPVSVSFALSTSNIPVDDENDHLRLTNALVNFGAVSLERLLKLQNKGWQDETIERYFRQHHQTSDTASFDVAKLWLLRMKKILCEIDEHLPCIPPASPFIFLDLGCCPGGFSSYILDKNVNARGVGVSLPVTEGGHVFCLEEHHRPRFQLTFHNLTYYQLGPSTIVDRRLQLLPLQISPESFDMVLLDGHQLRTQLDALPWDRDRLTISQLILGLQSVKEGGTIIMKLPQPHNPLAARVLYMFRIVSKQLLRWKPSILHSHRGTFYMVAKGIGRGPEGHRVQSFLLEFKKLWVDLTFGGEGGLGRHLVPEDLDFLLSMDDLIGHHLKWLMHLGTPLWTTQAKALSKLYRHHHV